MGTTKNFADVIKARKAQDQEFARGVARAAFFSDIGQMVYDARTKAGISQKELAERVGTQQSAISRIEDADYDGHSLNTLWKIADALNVNARVIFEERATEFVKTQETCEEESFFDVPWQSTPEWKLELVSA